MSKLVTDIEDALDRILNESHFKSIRGRWAIETGFLLHFYSSEISSYVSHAPQEIKNVLMCEDRKLYSMCQAIREKGLKELDLALGDSLNGGSILEVNDVVHPNGGRTVTKIRKGLSHHALKKFNTPERDDQLTFLTQQDSNSIEEYYSISEEKFIIPEREVLRHVAKLQTYQYGYFDHYNSFINDKDTKVIFKLFHLLGGFQSGKTVPATVIFGAAINMLANSKRKSGDTIIMAATMSSMRRNILGRLSAMFPTLKIPAPNQTIWKLPHGVTINLLTTQKISYHPLKGSSIDFCYIDELDSMHIEMFKLLGTRFTEKFEYKGMEKGFLLTTSNPKYPEHFISEYLNQGNTESFTMERVETPWNKYIPPEYLDRQANACGGRNTNAWKASMLGQNCHMSEASSVFKLVEEETFVDETVDMYLDSQCPTCGVAIMGENRDTCESCKNIDGFKGTKEFYKCNIGYDFGTSVQKVFVCTFLYIEDGIEKAIALDELVYEGGFDGQFAKAHGYQALIRHRENNMKEMIEACHKMTNNVEIFVPHDCPHEVINIEGIIEKYNLHCVVSRPPTPRNMPLSRAIGFMSDLLLTKRLLISNTCKTLKTQIYAYCYEDSKIDIGEEIIKKSNDHAVDAFRYSITPEYDAFS